MKGTVVISSNGNNDYLFFLPIVTFMWKKFGWNVVTLIPEYDLDCPQVDVINRLSPPKWTGLIYGLEHIDGIRSETMAQCCRLYAANIVSGVIMTSDMDMIPLSDYWNPWSDKITCYGRDLTDYHFPICYISAHSDWWKKVMNLTGDMRSDMMRDFDLFPQSKSNEWAKWWQIDQDIITERINERVWDIDEAGNKLHLELINRGTQPNNYPLGRIDRGCWEQSLQQPERIDAHLLRPGYTPENFEKILSLIQSVFPDENLDWMREYKNEYVALIN